MKLTEYVRILVRRGWIMLLLAAIAAVSAYTLSEGQTPIYRSTQLVLVQPSRTDFGLAEAASKLLEPLVVYLNSERIAGEIIEELQLDMTPGQLKGNATIVSDKFRMVIQIDIDSTDGNIANAIASAWGRKLADYRNEQNQLVRREDRVTAHPVDYPSFYQKAPKPKVMAIVGALLGFVVGGVIVFVLEYLESSIVRRREDLERIVDLPVLASIPDFE